MTLPARKALLERQLSILASVPVEITVRSSDDHGCQLTLSSEGDRVRQLAAVKAFLGSTGQMSDWQAHYDLETDYTYCYLTLHARPVTPPARVHPIMGETSGEFDPAEWSAIVD